MGKVNNNPEETLNNGANASALAPKAKDGKIILTAATRDELFKQFNDLKASQAGATLSAGAVGRQDDGSFVLYVNVKTKNS